MSATNKTGRAIYKSFENPGVKLGYIGTGICAGVSAGLSYGGEGMNFVALCTGVGAAGILVNTLRMQYKLAKRGAKKYQL